MGNFNRDRGGDRRGGGFNRRDQGRSGFNRGGRGGDRPAMHQAVCDACHKNCEVPFKPTGDKPIFCSDCFSKRGGGDRKPHFENRNRGSIQTNDNSKEILKGIKTLNYKFDELLKALSSDTPVKKTTKTKTITKKIAKKKTVKKKTTKKKK